VSSLLAFADFFFSTTLLLCSESDELLLDDCFFSFFDDRDLFFRLFFFSPPLLRLRPNFSAAEAEEIGELVSGVVEASPLPLDEEDAVMLRIDSSSAFIENDCDVEMSCFDDDFELFDLDLDLDLDFNGLVDGDDEHKCRPKSVGLVSTFLGSLILMFIFSKRALQSTTLSSGFLTDTTLGTVAVATVAAVEAFFKANISLRLVLGAGCRIILRLIIDVRSATELLVKRELTSSASRRKKNSLPFKLRSCSLSIVASI